MHKYTCTQHTKKIIFTDSVLYKAVIFLLESQKRDISDKQGGNFKRITPDRSVLVFFQGKYKVIGKKIKKQLTKELRVSTSGYTHLSTVRVIGKRFRER